MDFQSNWLRILLKTVTSFFTVEELFDYGPVFSLSHALKTMEIVKDLFGVSDETLKCRNGEMLPLNIFSLNEFYSGFWDEDGGDL